MPALFPKIKRQIFAKGYFPLSRTDVRLFVNETALYPSLKRGPSILFAMISVVTPWTNSLLRSAILNERFVDQESMLMKPGANGRGPWRNQNGLFADALVKSPTPGYAKSPRKSRRP